MRLSRMRFTIQSALIGVALVGLNLAAALATANAGGDWQRPMMRALIGRTAGGNLRDVDGRDEYGVGCLYNGPFNMSDGRGVMRLTEVWRAPLPATRLQIWSPLIVSVSITVLVLILRSWGRTGRPGGVAPDAGGGRRARHSALRAATRWVLLVVSLIALDLAGVVYCPGFNLYRHDAAHPHSPDHGARLTGAGLRSLGALYGPNHKYTLKLVGDFDPARRSRRASFTDDDPTTECLRMAYHELFVGPPKVLNVEVDGVLVERCRMERGEHEPFHEDETRLPDAIFRDAPDGEATIDFRSDGSILAYAGRAGKLLTQPRLIRTPTYSFLQMHGLAVASVAITGLVLAAVFRRLGPRQRRVLCIALVLFGLNAGAALVSHQIGEPPRLLSQLEATVRRGGTRVVRREEYFSDGSRIVSTRDLMEQSWWPEHAERPGPPPTFLRIWWPVLAGASITISVLVLDVLRLRGNGPRADSLAASDIADRSMAARG